VKPNLDSARAAASSLDIDLVLTPGSNSIKLNKQHAIVRAVIQASMENVRAALLFTNAFPDSSMATTQVKDCLLTAAKQLDKPGAMDVLNRLLRDEDYLSSISPLVRHFYSEMTSLMALPSRALEFA
jgi:hypothetical protein